MSSESPSRSGVDLDTADTEIHSYVSQSDASSLDLIAVMSDNSFVMRADAETQASGRGRNSIRISSKDKFADGVYIVDINHMPTGCGTVSGFY